MNSFPRQSCLQCEMSRLPPSNPLNYGNAQGAGRFQFLGSMGAQRPSGSYCRCGHPTWRCLTLPGGTSTWDSRGSNGFSEGKEKNGMGFICSSCDSMLNSPF